MKISTTRLQEMMSRAIRGVGNNKLLPLTTLISLKVEDGTFTITTTDVTNYLYVTSDIDSDDFYVCVQAEQFSKLIARMTSETITLEVKDNSLEVKGNGTYNIAIPMDEDGTMVKFPNPLSGVDYTNQIGQISVPTIKAILTTIKPALATTMNTPCYTGYYVNDSVIATDTETVNAMGVDITSEPKLISTEMMNLLDVVSSDADIFLAGDKIVFKSDDCVVYGSVLAGIENFNVNAIKGLMSQEFGSMCKIPKTNLLQLLDRIGLFVDTFDEGAITLTFTNDGLMISSRQSNGIEIIPYLSTNEFKEFTGLIDITRLQGQIKAQTSDSIELWYGADEFIKIVDGNITSIIALLVQ